MEATQDERVAYIVKVRRQHRQDVAKWVSYLVGAHSVYRNLLVGRWYEKTNNLAEEKNNFSIVTKKKPKFNWRLW